MTPHRLFRFLSAVTLVGAIPLAAQTLRPQKPPSVISLDHRFVSPAADVVPVKGETSFANPPDDFYAFASTRAGETSPIEAIHLRFSAATTLTSIESTKDFTIEPGGSCVKGQSYAKNDTCIVLMRFTPQGAGGRLGTLSIGHSGSPTPDAFGIGGYGYSPVVSFTPALISTVPGTYPSKAGLLSGAPNLAVDGGDVLYIADVGNNLLRKIDSSGTITSITPFFATPISIAVDSFGIVWALSPSGSFYYFLLFEPWSTQGADGAAYVATTCTPASPCNLGSVGMSNPAEMSIDSNNNLFMEEGTQGALEMPVTGYSGGNGTLELWHLLDQYAYFTGTPSTFAVDRNDDLFTALSYPFENTCFILDEPLYGAEIGNPTTYRIAGANGCGYSGDGGQGADAEISSAIGQMTFDIAGNLYFSDTNNQRVRRVDYNTGIITTIAGNGTAGYVGDGGGAKAAKLSYPTGVAVDSQGQVYIISGTGTTTGGAQVVRKLGPNGVLSFPSIAVGTTSSGLIVTLSNTGNSTLTLGNHYFAGTDSGDFAIDTTTTNCPLTVGSTLNAGQSCKVGVVFKPKATGARSAKLVFLDNTVATQNIVQLSGTGAAAAASLAPSPLTFPSTTVNQQVTQSVTLANTGNADLSISSITVGGTNPKMFTLKHNCGSSVAPKESCTLQVTFAPLTSGSHSAVLTVNDNTPKSPQTLAMTGTGLALPTASVQVSSASNPANGCAPVLFSVAVKGAGEVPTGMVQLERGATVLSSAPLSNGHALLATTVLTPGSNSLRASYTGDRNYGPSASSAFTQTMSATTSCVGARPLQLTPAADR